MLNEVFYTKPRVVVWDNGLDEFVRYSATTGGSGGGGSSGGGSSGGGGKGWYIVIAILCILSLVGKCGG